MERSKKVQREIKERKEKGKEEKTVPGKHKVKSEQQVDGLVNRSRF